MKVKLLSLLIALVTLLSLTACAGSVKNDLAFDKESAPQDPMESDTPDVSPDFSYGTNSEDFPSIDESSTVVGGAQAMSEKIIRTVTIDAQTKEYDSSLAYIRSAAVALGGFEETFRSTGKNYNGNYVYSRSAYMRLRIPATQLDTFLAEVGDTINVLSQNSTADNVTGEYYDIQTRISVLESEREAYEQMLQQSMDIDYLLKVKDRLYDVIEEIEAYQTRLNVLDSKVAYSTVSISLSEVVEYTPVVTKEPTFGKRVADAFTSSWKSFAKGCQNFAVGFVAAIPTLLLLAIVATLALTICFKIKRRHKRTPTKQETPEDNKHD